MNKREVDTLKLIHTAAKKEFLEKGFQCASLRNIVKAAGVTTGAFYGYYKSKEDLFSALVEKQYNCLMNKYRDAQNIFADFSLKEQEKNIESYIFDIMSWIAEYIYSNLDAFKLILCCSEGTKYENLIHEMAVVEVEATHNFAKSCIDVGRDIKGVNPKLEHMLISGMFSAFFEMFVHDVPKEQSKEYIGQLLDFYIAGWQKIMGF